MLYSKMFGIWDSRRTVNVQFFLKKQELSDYIYIRKSQRHCNEEWKLCHYEQGKQCEQAINKPYR